MDPESGRIAYCNDETGETTWDRPGIEARYLGRVDLDVEMTTSKARGLPAEDELVLTFSKAQRSRWLTLPWAGRTELVLRASEVHVIKDTNE